MLVLCYLISWKRKEKMEIKDSSHRNMSKVKTWPWFFRIYKPSLPGIKSRISPLNAKIKFKVKHKAAHETLTADLDRSDL